MKLLFLLLGLVSLTTFPTGDASIEKDATLTFQYNDGSEESFTISSDLLFSADPAEFDKFATKDVVICSVAWGNPAPNDCTGTGANCSAAFSRFNACNCEKGIKSFCNGSGPSGPPPTPDTGD